MMAFWKCVAYLVLIGTLAHFAGLMLSHHRFTAHRAPWRSASWENEGRFWDRALRVRRWMDLVPDMSRIMPDMVPKRIVGVATPEQIDILIRETCVAELIHWLLFLLGFECVFIWNGAGGWIVSLLFGIGNLPYVVIQRYNRPRLMRLHRWLLSKQQRDTERAERADAQEVAE